MSTVAPGANLARGRVLHHVDRHDAEIEGGARGRQLDQLGRAGKAEDELVAGGALEARAQLLQARRHRAARQHRELGRPRGGWRQHHREGEHGGGERSVVHWGTPDCGADKQGCVAVPHRQRTGSSLKGVYARLRGLWRNAWDSVKRVVCRHEGVRPGKLAYPDLRTCDRIIPTRP